MLVDAPRGETTGFASWYAELWLEEPLTLRAFRSLLGVRRFFGVAEDETLEALLAESAKDQQEVTDQLGYQVRRAVEVLVQASTAPTRTAAATLLAGVDESAALRSRADGDDAPGVPVLGRGARPAARWATRSTTSYYAVSTLRAQLRETADQHGEEVLERRYDAWSRLLATFRAVYGGVEHDACACRPTAAACSTPTASRSWKAAPAATRPGATPRADPLPINNRTVLHLLEALQMLQVKVPGGGPAEARRLSFRALDIEQIGHVYEGLLDHTAVRATEPVLGLAGTQGQRAGGAAGRAGSAASARARTALPRRSRTRPTGRSGVNALRNALAAPAGPGVERQAACAPPATTTRRSVPARAALRRAAARGRLRPARW